MLEINHLKKSYRSRAVLTDVTFLAESGECIGLVGPNGCGKSTLLQLLAGMIRPDGGSISLNGTILNGTSAFASSIGYVPQENPLFPDATAIDHLRLAYSGVSASLEDDLKNGFPAKLGISSFLKRKVSAMSGGMKKRLSLACACAGDPPVILMDEPAAALDIAGKQQIRSQIKALTDAGKIVLIATHEEADFPLCNALLIFDNGTVKRVPPDAPVASLFQNADKEPPEGGAE